MRGGEGVAKQVTVLLLDVDKGRQMFSERQRREAHWAKLDRWRHEARGADAVKRRCARFYLSQINGGPVIPT